MPFSLSGLDLKAMGRAMVKPLLWWMVAVVGASFSGYPGVVCITPMAWLLALLVGRDCVFYSNSPQRRQRLWEAGLAGGLLGLIFGLIFAAVMLIGMPLLPGEMGRGITIALVMTLVGIVFCAGLAWFMALLTLQRL